MMRVLVWAFYRRLTDFLPFMVTSSLVFLICV
jgi:hypothetical protein